MSKISYSIDQLRSLGFDEQQIAAITASDEKRDVSGQASVNEVSPLNITSISDLHAYGKGAIVRLPDFAEGQPFIVRLRRPSMLVLAKQGKIPNALLYSANALFTKGGQAMDEDRTDMLSEIYDICEVIAEAALVEPTYKDIKSAGIELSDEQLMAIFNYSQSGVKALESFR